MSLTIACYGDSTMFGWTTNGRVGGPQPYADGTVQNQVTTPAPQGLQALLLTSHPSVTVQNLGHVGTTCTDYLNGNPASNVPQPWAAEMQLSRAHWVLILLGINDDPDELAENYPKLVAIAQAAGKRVIIQTPNACDSTVIDLTQRVGNEREIHAANPGSILVDFYRYTQTMNKGWHDQLSYSTMFKVQEWAGVHPTQTGYDTMAQFQRAILEPIIMRMGL